MSPQPQHLLEANVDQYKEVLFHNFLPAESRLVKVFCQKELWTNKLAIRVAIGHVAERVSFVGALFVKFVRVSARPLYPCCSIMQHEKRDHEAD